MPASHLELFVSWVPLIGGSLGAMIGGILSDRIAKVSEPGEESDPVNVLAAGKGGERLRSRYRVPIQLWRQKGAVLPNLCRKLAC